jgi:transcription elongation GreA/GreB family factor
MATHHECDGSAIDACRSQPMDRHQLLETAAERIAMNSHVTYAEEPWGDQLRVKLVRPVQADAAAGRVSVPLGRALHGRRPGTIVHATGFGRPPLKIRILSAERAQS